MGSACTEPQKDKCGIKVVKSPPKQKLGAAPVYDPAAPVQFPPESSQPSYPQPQYFPPNMQEQPQYNQQVAQPQYYQPNSQPQYYPQNPQPQAQYYVQNPNMQPQYTPQTNYTQPQFVPINYQQNPGQQPDRGLFTYNPQGYNNMNLRTDSSDKHNNKTDCDCLACCVLTCCILDLCLLCSENRR